MSRSENLPEDKQRWVEAVQLPTITAIDGVCHMLIVQQVQRFATAKWRGFCLVEKNKLGKYLSEEQAALVAAVFGDVGVENELMAA